VAELLRGISSSELGEWMAFARLEPFGDARLRAGVIAATVANVHRRRETPAFGAGDFFPELAEHPAEKRPEAGTLTVMSAMAMTMALGGKVQRRGH